MNSEIQVFALFPHSIVHVSDSVIEPTDWHWVPCLKLPLERFNSLHLSVHPYKWVRYAMSVVVGAKGDLSSSAESLEIIDYNAKTLTEEPANLYYHSSDEERQRMYPIDPNLARSSRTSLTSSITSAGKDEFGKNVEQRDGKRCVLAGVTERFAGSVHLIPRLRGDRYISNYTAHRSDNQLIQSIDDIRNGLFLNNYTHAGLGTDVAFLPTPNFAMTTADIDAAADPTEQRYTANLFDINPGLDCALGRVPPGTPIRIPDSPDRPPAFLFESVYGTAVVHNFGTQTFKDYVSSTWGDVFYPDDVRRVSHDERRERLYLAQDRVRTHVSYLDALIMSTSQPLWQVLSKQREERDLEEREQLIDKVETWRMST